MAKLITKEQMAEQESYIMKLKEENMRYAAQNGHAKLALTETYGCQQNENDTERIRGMLRQAGFDFTDDSNKADVVIYNTCAVRENAEQKVFGRLGILKHIKEERKDMVIGVCGCMVQQEHITEKIKKVHEHVDLVFGTHALYKMPEPLFLFNEPQYIQSCFDISSILSYNLCIVSSFFLLSLSLKKSKL